MAETLELTAEVIGLPEHVSSNIAALQAACLDMAERYAGVASIETADAYRQAKRDRTAVRAALKQVDDERKRVKSAWMHPLNEFTSAVDSATSALREVEAKQKAAIAAYEDAGREAKRGRLRAYWEGAYPALALCAGESDEPLVPFERVFDPDWTKRVSELPEGRDGAAREAMDRIAAKLAEGERMIDGLTADHDLKLSAKARMFETLDPVAAAHGIEVEARKRRDIERMQAAQAASIAEARAADAPQAEQDAPCAPEAPAPAGPEPETARAPRNAPERPTVTLSLPAGAAVPEGCAAAVVVWCASKEDMQAAVAAMRGAGLHGCAGRVM